MPVRDKAGKEHWDKTWGMCAAKLIDPTLGGLANEVNRRFHRYFSKIITPASSGPRYLLEVGCAHSFWLPYFARHYGLAVCGLDYSEEGCRQEEAMLMAAGVDGRIVCADLFSPPAILNASFDYVFTMGVVEHFTDTTACVSALSQFLRPGGTMITVIPNMLGTVGALQFICDREIYDMHMRLTPKELGSAHLAAGLVDVDCHYFLSTNYYVVNSMCRRNSILHAPLRLLGGLMGRASMAVWLLESHIGEFPYTMSYSPYIVCKAIRRQS